MLDNHNLQEGQDLDDTVWNVSMAAGVCLGLVALTVRDDIIPLVIAPFVQVWPFSDICRVDCILIKDSALSSRIQSLRVPCCGGLLHDIAAVTPRSPTSTKTRGQRTGGTGKPRPLCLAASWRGRRQTSWRSSWSWASISCCRCTPYSPMPCCMLISVKARAWPAP